MKRFTASHATAPTTLVELKKPERLLKLLTHLLHQQDARKIEAILLRIHPADIAKIVTLLPMDLARDLIHILFRIRKGAATVAELPAGFRESLLEGFDAKMMAEFARRVDPDDAADILQKLPEEQLQEVLKILNIDEVNELKALLAYAEDSAGAIMNPDYFWLPPDISVDTAIERIREQGEKLRDVMFVYVLDQNKHLLGFVSMRDLLLANGHNLLAEICNKNFYSVEVNTPEETVAEIMAKYDLIVIPVLDEHKKMLGVITIDDIIDVLKETATEDIYSMVALDQDDRVFSPALQSVTMRLPWLTLNFATAFAAVITVGLFEETIQHVVALVTLMPVVAGLGGNSGSQTLTVVIRGMALGELQPVNARQAVIKEINVGVINGLLLGALGCLIGWLWKGHWWIGALLGTAIVLNLCIAAAVGASVPLILRRLRLDPAMGSQIFLTAITDAFGFFAFLGLASWLLPRLGVY